MKKYQMGKIIGLIWMTVIIMGCGFSTSISPTPTPTDSAFPLPSVNGQCKGLSGEVEMQVLVGPAEVVGLEPLIVGTVPFSVVSESGSYVIEGNNNFTYDNVLEKEWGTYTVSFDLEAIITGTCVEDGQSGTLQMTIQTMGSQLIEVRATGFQGDYPWTGTHDFTITFPIEEGAIAEGEGWTFLLHVND